MDELYATPSDDVSRWGSDMQISTCNNCGNEIIRKRGEEWTHSLTREASCYPTDEDISLYVECVELS